MQVAITLDTGRFGVTYAAGGVDFVLDDWSFAGYRAANGTMTDAFLRSRPGTWAVQTIGYGIAGEPVAAELRRDELGPGL